MTNQPRKSQSGGKAESHAELTTDTEAQAQDARQLPGRTKGRSLQTPPGRRSTANPVCVSLTTSAPADSEPESACQLARATQNHCQATFKASRAHACSDVRRRGTGPQQDMHGQRSGRESHGLPHATVRRGRDTSGDSSLATVALQGAVTGVHAASRPGAAEAYRPPDPLKGVLTARALHPMKREAQGRTQGPVVGLWQVHLVQSGCDSDRLWAARPVQASRAEEPPCRDGAVQGRGACAHTAILRAAPRTRQVCRFHTKGVGTKSLPNPANRKQSRE